MPFQVTKYRFMTYMISRFVNALCYLLDWKCLISLGTVSLMHVDLTFQLSCKSAKVKCFFCCAVNANVSFLSPVSNNVRQHNRKNWITSFVAFSWIWYLFNSNIWNTVFITFLILIQCQWYQFVKYGCMRILLLQGFRYFFCLWFSLSCSPLLLEYRAVFYHV